MKELFSAILSRLDAGENAVLCCILASSGSTPRGAGAKMAVFADGTTLGTVGGGAVEQHAAAQAMAVHENGCGCVKGYSLAPGEAGDIGMICGGNVTVYFRLFTPADHAEVQGIIDQCGVSQDSWLVYVLRGGELTDFTVWTDAPARPLSIDASLVRPLLGARAVYRKGDPAIYVEPLVRCGRALIFGAGHVARALAPVLSGIGLPVLVFDDRAPLADPGFFPTAEQVVCAPFSDLSQTVSIGAGDAVIVMTPGHEADFEVLAQVLRTPADYVGCIGSRHKVARTKERLRQAGIGEQDIARLHSPIGLNIGAETPAEIAISIAAELIAHRAGYERDIGWATAES